MVHACYMLPSLQHVFCNGPCILQRKLAHAGALRSLSYPLATPLATPHWLQTGPFHTPANTQHRSTAHASAAPHNRQAFGNEGQPQAALRGEEQGGAQAAQRDEAGAPESSGQAEFESELRVLSGNEMGEEEEVLVQELQALQAARQELQRASLSQVTLHHALHYNQ